MNFHPKIEHDAKIKTWQVFRLEYRIVECLHKKPVSYTLISDFAPSKL